MSREHADDQTRKIQEEEEEEAEGAKEKMMIK